jgi:cytochrome c peroxidase
MILRAAIIALLTFHGSAAFAAEIDFRFEHSFDGSPLILSSLRYSLQSGETISVTRLSYILSGFALEKSEGGWVELTNQFAWNDLEKRRTAFTLNDIPKGDYRGLRFSVGLDKTINSNDPARYAASHPLNPNLNALHWSWRGGYIFIALEGMYRDGSNDIGGYSYHFAGDTNQTVVTLPFKLRFAGENEIAGATITFDVGALLHAPRPISPLRDGTSTHSRDGDPIAAALKANLPGAFQVREIVGRGVQVAKSSPVKPLYLPRTFTPYPFRMSARFPVPDLPRDNPLLVERVELGEKLFSEPLLSRNNRISCASCHDRARAFSDSRRFSIGVEDRSGTRNAMPLFNMAWKSSFFWDGRAGSLRKQAAGPIQDHAEMDEALPNLPAKLASAPAYANLFTRAFGNTEITFEKICLALENYVLTLTSYDSKFDRAMSGKVELAAEEKRGFELFFTEYEPRLGQFGADCFHCHGGALFTDNQFHNNGLDLTNALDEGRYRVTHKEYDLGKFSTPSLRNVALTTPYMHDGRFNTLEEVVEHYSTGVRHSPTLDPNLAKHPINGLHLSDIDKKALVAFLRTLTDEKFSARTLAVNTSEAIRKSRHFQRQ